MDFVIDTKGSVKAENNAPSYSLHINETKSNSVVQQLLAEYNDSDLVIETVSTYNKKPHHDLERSLNATALLPDKSKKLIGKNGVKELLKLSVITTDFELLHAVPPYDLADKKLKEQRRRDREKSKGKKWFGLPATEVTDEIKKDLEVLQMRSVLDPKHFYKKNDLKVLPKYFQVGKVMDSPLDYYNSRLTRKERKKTLVDELLADAEFNKYNKKKYLEIIEERKKTHYKAYKHARKLKRKNKN